MLPGAREFVESCQASGIKTALGSASKNSETILAKVGISHLFDVVIDGNRVSKPKPDPEVFLKGAEELHIAPRNCVVFEDAIAGIEAAKNGGMLAVGIGSATTLVAADIVVSGLDQMSIEKLNDLGLLLQ